MDEHLPFEGGESHPFFMESEIHYMATYSLLNNKEYTVYYNSPHELILGIWGFKNQDTITYIRSSDGEVLFTITVEKFKYRIASGLYTVPYPDLELLYLRLLLSIRKSKNISDKGIFLQHTYSLFRYLSTIRGGTDIYLASEKLRTILYLKYRRNSLIHLLAVLNAWTDQNPDILLCHINLPSTMPHKPILIEYLQLFYGKRKIRIHEYHPDPETDQMMTTDNSREIILVINQLIK